MKLLFIVGLQKSGTTLLLELLARYAPGAGNPFFGEGHSFWGNTPWTPPTPPYTGFAFPPTDYPAGAVYARTDGERGHEITAADATPEVRRVLHERLEQLPERPTLLLNKNPFNTVRLPWLRALFPESCIVAMIRRPLPHVFSLRKKYDAPGERTRAWQADGWYGTKPACWRTLRHADRLVQCARQWRAVNEKLYEDRACVDLIVPYHRLCAAPAAHLRRILRAATGTEEALLGEVPALPCFDDEYATGAALRSKNFYLRQQATLQPAPDEAVEQRPLTSTAIARVTDCCRPVATLFNLVP